MLKSIGFTKALNTLNKKVILSFTKTIAVSSLLFNVSGYVQAEELGYPEKEELTFGFIKLTDMAPIAIAYEKGYFEDEGLYVTIEAQANWKVF